jgi:broad specificity phosphatase PhoE
MGKLILVRHGRTDLNRPGREERLRAWKDIPLDECGMQEAKDTAQQLAGLSVEIIYSSDLVRARQTAEAIQRVVKAPIVTTQNLRPWNLGKLAGQVVQDIIPILERLNRDLTEKAPAGESFNEFYERYERQVRELLQVANVSSSHVVAVTHGRNFMALPAILDGGDRTHIPVMSPVQTAGAMVVEKHAAEWRIAHDPIVRRRDEVPEPPLSYADLGDGQKIILET